MEEINMKKIIVLLFILFIVFLTNLVRNNLILHSIINSNKIFSENINNYNYYFEENIIENNNNYKNCIYSQGNNYYIEIYINNEHISNIWIDTDKKEYIVEDVKNQVITSEEYDDYYTRKYKDMCLYFHDININDLIVKKYLFTPIILENKKYSLSIYENDKIFIDKESKLITKAVTNDYEINYTFDNKLPENNTITKPQS